MPEGNGWEREKDSGHILYRFIVVCVVMTMQIIAMMILRQTTPLYLESLEVSPTVLGLAVSSFRILPFLISIPGGLVVDRVGHRRVICAGAGLMVVSGLIMASLPSVLSVIVAQLVGGLGHMLIVVATQAYVSDLAPDDRTKYFGLYSFAIGAGFLIGPPLAGAVNDIWGFSICFMALSLVAGLVVGLASRMQKANEFTATEGTERSPLPEFAQVLQNCRKLLSQPLIRLSLSLSMCALLVMTLRSSFFIVHLNNVGLSSTQIGLLLAVLGGVSLLLRPFLNHLTDLLGVLPLISTSMALGAFGLYAVSVFHSFIPLVAATVLFGFTPTFSQPLSMVMMADSSPDEIQGMALGFRQMANQVSLFTGPVMFGVVVTHFGLQAAFWLAGFILLAASGLFMFIHFRFHDQLENL